jgi:hypothetical protein
VRTLSETSNDHALCCMLNHGNTLVQSLHCLSVSSCSSTQLFHPLHSCFCCNLNRATWSGIICDFRTSLREFLDRVVNRFTRQTLHTVNRKNVFMNILLAHKKGTTERCSSVEHPSCAIAILTTETASQHAHSRLLPILS